MELLRETIALNPGAWLAMGGLLIGMVFGFVVFRTNFCAMGAVSDIVSFGDYRRFRSWLLAGATAIAGTQLIAALGVVPLSKSMYLAPSLNWLGNIAGGLMFGFGMVFSGGCASRNLARVGGGDLRSLMVLIVMGLFAYMTIGGLLGPARSWLEQSTSLDLRGLAAGGGQLASQGIGALLAASVRLPAVTADLVAAAVIAGAIAVYCFASREFLTSPIHLAAGVGIGLCAVAGWALTGLAFDELADRPLAPISLTYVRPTGDAIEWLQRFTAGMVPGFGVASVFGAILGAFLAAVMMGRFSFTTFSGIGDTRRSLFGAALMGIGGVLALGCTVGQAITGISTLALGSFITFAAIVAGAVRGIKALEHSLMNEA